MAETTRQKNARERAEAAAAKAALPTATENATALSGSDYVGPETAFEDRDDEGTLAEFATAIGAKTYELLRVRTGRNTGNEYQQIVLTDKDGEKHYVLLSTAIKDGLYDGSLTLAALNPYPVTSAPSTRVEGRTDYYINEPADAAIVDSVAVDLTVSMEKRGEATKNVSQLTPAQRKVLMLAHLSAAKAR